MPVMKATVGAGPKRRGAAEIPDAHSSAGVMPENGETGRENGQPKTCHTYGKRGDSGLKGTPGSDGDLAKDDGNRVTKVSTKSGQEAAKKISAGGSDLPAH